jgi:hypothetical protein
MLKEHFDPFPRCGLPLSKGEIKRGSHPLYLNIIYYFREIKGKILPYEKMGCF